MPLAYSTGEQIQSGDRIRYHGESGQVELVARLGDAGTAWYIEQFGQGCMILAPAFGRVFVSEPDQDEDLKFISRAAPP